MKKLIAATFFALILLTSTTQAADQGIKVHGHWTFKIYNPDGSFDRKVEFDNALLDIGAIGLLRMLNKEQSVGTWGIDLLGPPASPYLCKDGNSDLVVCQITEPDAGLNAPNVFNNLTVGLDNNANPTKLILSGSLTTAIGIAANSSIGSVRTQLGTCNATFVPGCPSGTNGIALFTAKEALTIPVSPGQIVQVTVEISFS